MPFCLGNLHYFAIEFFAVYEYNSVIRVISKAEAYKEEYKVT